MRTIADLSRIILSRWKNARRLTVMTLLNLAAGVCIFALFVNIGLNISRYMEKTFFSDERLRHVLLTADSGSSAADADRMLAETGLDGARVILDADARVLSVGGEPLPGDFSPDVTVMRAENYLFPDEFFADRLFSAAADEPLSGVVLSRKALPLFGDDPIGTPVEFEFRGQRVTLPVTAVLETNAEENYDLSYRSVLYWITDAPLSADTGFRIADLRLADMNDVESFTEKYGGSGFRLVSSLSDIRHIRSLSAAVSLILTLVGAVFAAVSAIGIKNCLDYSADMNIRSAALLQVIGFDSALLRRITLLESCYLALLSSLPAAGVLFLFSAVMKGSGALSFGFISTEGLFDIHPVILLILPFAALAVILACKAWTGKANRSGSVLDTLRKER